MASKNIEYVGLTKLAEDIVRGLSIVEDPTHVHLIGVPGEVEPRTFHLKKWRGALNGEEVHVREYIQTTVNDGHKLLLFSNIIIRGSEEYSIAGWSQNPLMDNSAKKHDKNSGHYKIK